MKKILTVIFLLLLLGLVGKMMWTVVKERQRVGDICGLAMPVTENFDWAYRRQLFECKLKYFSKLAFWSFDCSDIELPNCSLDENSAALCRVRIARGDYQGSQEECERSYVCPTDLGVYQQLKDQCLKDNYQ